MTKINLRYAALSYDRAERVALAIADPRYRAHALVDMAKALVVAGDPIRAIIAAERAEEEAANVGYSAPRAGALTDVAQVLVLAGDLSGASRVADLAEEAAHAIEFWKHEEAALIDVSTVQAAAGNYVRAEQVAQSMSDGYPVEALVNLAGVLAVHEKYGEAERVGMRIEIPFYRVRALTGVAHALIATGLMADAARVASVAERIALTCDDFYGQAGPLTSVAEAYLGAGFAADAMRVATAAEHFCRNAIDPYFAAYELGVAAVVLADAGQYDRAERIARTISTHLGVQMDTLSKVAEFLALAGYVDRAKRMAREIQQPDLQAAAMIQIAKALVSTGRYMEADEILQSISLDDRTKARFVIIHSLAAAGDYHRAEEIAIGINDPNDRVVTLLEIAAWPAWPESPAETARLTAVAEQIALNIDDWEPRSQALARTAEIIASTGNQFEALRAATAAENAVKMIDSSYRRDLALPGVIRALLAVGEYDRCEKLALTFTESPRDQVSALEALCSALVKAGFHKRAERTAFMIDPERRTAALVVLVEGLATVDRKSDAIRLVAVAERTALQISDPFWKTKALIVMIRAWLLVDNDVESVRIAQLAKESAADLTPDYTRKEALTELVRALVNVESYEQAERTALTIGGRGQADALAFVARALAETGNAAEGGRLAVLCCLAGPWFVARNLLDEMDKSGLRSLVDDLLQRLET